MTEHFLTADPPKHGDFSGGASDRTSREARPNGPTLFLVESDVLVRIPLSEYLRGCGYRVIECSTAEEAIVLIEAGEQVDILFSEITLAGEMNGFALAKWIRQERPSVKVVLASGVTNLANTSEKVCADGPIIPKPYAYEALAAQLKRLRPRR